MWILWCRLMSRSKADYRAGALRAHAERLAADPNPHPLKVLRHARDLTQVELAFQSMTNLKTVKMAEARRRKTKPETWRAWAAVLNVDPKELQEDVC
jgi:hypothetical protein